MSTTTELLFLGLPGTGKTTYFVALDEVIQRQTDQQHGLISDGFAANRTYIEKAKVAWRAGKEITRTNLTPTTEPVELRVRHPETDAATCLTAPDVFGEFFDDQWADRKWPIAYRERLASISGILLFIHAAKSGRNSEMTAFWQNLPKKKTQPDQKTQKQEHQVEQEPHQRGEEQKQGKQPISKPWEARAAAEQVKLVDLLQVIAERGRTKRPLPLAVMISAWDLIESMEAPKFRPEDFLQKDWALLSQYLQANQEVFRSRVFAVSARGGDDASQAALVRLAPHQRVWLKDGSQVTRDLTRPVRWLLDWE